MSGQTSKNMKAGSRYYIFWIFCSFIATFGVQKSLKISKKKFTKCTHLGKGGLIQNLMGFRMSGQTSKNTTTRPIFILLLLDSLQKF
jgi:hypothetical protein